jgi:hypothetical protein
MRASMPSPVEALTLFAAQKPPRKDERVLITHYYEHDELLSRLVRDMTRMRIVS